MNAHKMNPPPTPSGPSSVGTPLPTLSVTQPPPKGDRRLRRPGFLSSVGATPFPGPQRSPPAFPAASAPQASVSWAGPALRGVRPRSSRRCWPSCRRGAITRADAASALRREELHVPAGSTAPPEPRALVVHDPQPLLDSGHCSPRWKRFPSLQHMRKTEFSEIEI